MALIVRARICRSSTAGSLAAASVAVSAGCSVTEVRHKAHGKEERSENRKNAHYYLR
jgi:hypothetical protein